MTEPARVYHNIEADTLGRPLGACGYHFLHEVTLVAELSVVELDDDFFNWSRTLDHIFHVLNVGDDPAYGIPDPQAVKYRKRHNRSLSVGDVIEMRGLYWAVDRSGFKLLDARPVIVEKSVPGSTNLDLFNARSDGPRMDQVALHNAPHGV